MEEINLQWSETLLEAIYKKQKQSAPNRLVQKARKEINNINTEREKSQHTKKVKRTQKSSNKSRNTEREKLRQRKKREKEE